MSLLTQLLRCQFRISTLLSLLLLYYLAQFVRLCRRIGLKNASMRLFISAFLMSNPIGRSLLKKETSKEIANVRAQLTRDPEVEGEPKYLVLPGEGVPPSHLLPLLTKWKSMEERHWRGGQLSGSVYHGGEQLSAFLCEVYSLYSCTNPLQLDVFKMVSKMEREVLSMSLSLFEGSPTACGVLTSGGTESILMAMKAYRDWHRHRIGEEDAIVEIVLSPSAHCAFDKAAHYFSMKCVYTNMEANFKMDTKGLSSLINRYTACIVASAPSFPQGVIDPIEDIAKIAIEYNVGCHVDSCLGGFILPFLRDSAVGPFARDDVKGDSTIPKFDFSVPGVTSLSADTHKYGFAPKGSSVLLYRSRELRSYQFYVNSSWMGGIYASPSMQGTRTGGLIAACWASLMYHGHKGYTKSALEIYGECRKIYEGICSIEGLQPMIPPRDVTCVVPFTCDPHQFLNIYHVGAAMNDGSRGRHWHLNSLQNPAGLHIVVTRLQVGLGEKFVKDLRQSVEEVRREPHRYAKSGTAGVYGMAGGLPESSTIIEDIAKEFIGANLDANR